MQVIEGRNIRPIQDVLHGFYAIDGYVQVAVHSEAGDTALATKAERGSLAPVWNKALAFADVALGNSVTVSLFDHKKLSADVLIGQVQALFKHSSHPLSYLIIIRPQPSPELCFGLLFKCMTT